MIILKIQGGLGNQMFEYALGRNVQIETNKKLLLDISDYKYDDKRKFSLNNYELNEDIIFDNSGKYNIKYDQRKNWIIKVLFKTIPKLAFDLFTKFGVYIWDTTSVVELEVLKNRKRLYFHGYWQNIDYFSKNEKVIKNDFTLRNTLNDRNKKIVEKYKNENSVCVHIRRGDYLKNQHYLVMCDENYYTSAMDIICNRIDSPKFYVFSDDIDDVKKNFNFSSYDVEYMIGKNKDYEELELMRNCKHFIISNSTFSWWAAFLGEDCKKTIVTPKNWFIGRERKNLNLDSWIAIDN